MLRNKKGSLMYFVGFDPILKANGKPLLLFATDVNNPNTYSRYSYEYYSKYKEANYEV